MATPTDKPVPSVDPNDLLYNAEKLDQVVNSSGASYTDRTGVSRRTVHGIKLDAEAQVDVIEADALAQRTAIQAAADLVLAGIGYAPPVAYAVGLSMTSQTQTVSYNGNVYAPKVADLPFVTSGTFETAKFRLIQGVAEADLEGLVDALQVLRYANSELPDDTMDENSTQVITAAMFSSLTNATANEAGGVVTITKTGTGATAQAPSCVIPQDADWLLYMKVMLDGEGPANIQLGGAGDAKMVISLGYDWVAGAAAPGVISATWNGVAKVLATGVDYIGDYVYLMLQYDDNFEALNVWSRNDTTKVFSLLGYFSGAFVYTTIMRVTFAGTTATGRVLTFGNVRYFCKPNYIAIGDSICKGATQYDPDPDATSDKNFDSCWERYCVIPGRENTFIVNKGIGGQTSAQINSRIATDVLPHGARKVALHLSTNDYGGGLTQAQRATYTQDSIDQMRAAGLEVLLLSAVYPNSNAANYPLNSNYYKAFMTDASGFVRLSGYSQFVPFMDAIDDANGDIATAYAAGDGVHPTPAGYALIGPMVQEAWTPSEMPKVAGSLEIGGSLVVRGTIRGRLDGDTILYGWHSIRYVDAASPKWEKLAKSGNSENLGLLSLEDGASADEVYIHFKSAAIIPGSFQTYGTGGTFNGLARLVSITAVTAGEDYKARYVIRKLSDGSTPTGSDLNNMQFFVKY